MAADNAALDFVLKYHREICNGAYESFDNGYSCIF